MYDPNDPNALDPNVSLTGKKRGKAPMIVIGVIIVGLIGVFLYRSSQKQAERKQQVAFLDSFASIEKDDLGKFWKCLLGDSINIDMIQDNLALTGRVTGEFGMDPKNYPNKVTMQCTGMATDARHKVESLSPPTSDYDAPLKQYAGALKDLGAALDAWSRIAPSQVQDMEVARLVDSDGAAWHGFAGGKNVPKEVASYDRFVHCAIPDLDKMKDGQAVVEFLFKQCKDPSYAQKVNEQCGKELTSEMPLGPTKGMMGDLRKLANDDREISAFDDCLRKGRKNKRADDFADVGKAFVAWMNAGTEIRKIGKEALKDQ